MFVANKSYAQLFRAFNTSKWSNDIESQLQNLKSSFEDKHYPYHLEKKLSNAILNCDIDEIEKISYEFGMYSNSDLCHGNPLRSAKNNFICNTTILTRLALEVGLEESISFSLSDLYINKVEELTAEEHVSTLSALMLIDYTFRIKNILAKKYLYSDIVKKAINYIENNIENQISLTSAADEIGVNISYLSRTFKKETGITFVNYMHIARIERAKQLILFNNYSFGEVALLTGYTTQSHFIKIFKEITKETPGAFRLKYLGEPNQSI